MAPQKIRERCNLMGLTGHIYKTMIKPPTYGDGITIARETVTINGRPNFYNQRTNSDSNLYWGIEVAYTRQQPRLHGWFEQLFAASGGQPQIYKNEETQFFNGETLELYEQDIINLKYDITTDNLPFTSGPRFGDLDTDEHYHNERNEMYLELCQKMFNAFYQGYYLYYYAIW